MFLLKNITQNLYVNITLDQDNHYHSKLVDKSQATQFFSHYDCQAGIDYLDKIYKNDEYTVEGEYASDFDDFIKEEKEYQYELYLEGYI